VFYGILAYYINIDIIIRKLYDIKCQQKNKRLDNGGAMKTGKRRRYIHIIASLLIIELMVIVGLLLYFNLRSSVVDDVVIEVGDKIPDVDSFLKYKNRKGKFVTDLSNIDVNKPGDYDIQIKAGYRTETARLHIVDTIPPEAEVKNLMVLKGDDVQADDFITEIVDATEVKASFQEVPDTAVPGEKEVNIILTDSGGNSTVKKARLTVLDIKSKITVEAGSDKDISIEDFIIDRDIDISFITDVTAIDKSKPAIHEILLNVNGREVTGYIEVVDTTPPKAICKNLEIWKNDALPDAMSFISSLEDVSSVTAEYKTLPDLKAEGAQEIVIVLKDEFGNISEESAILTIKEDTEPPRIMGAKDKTVYIGDSISYKKGVYVVDNKDDGLEVKVDSSKVNLNKEGVYDVKYYAEDSSGNKAELTVKVTVVKLVVTKEVLDEEVDKILKKIITPKMTKLEKAEAIYRWIKKNVSYVGDSDKSDWIAEAYRAIKKGKGDCFTFFAISQAMLTRAGIDNMQVTRVGGKTQHFWNLVNCGDGWYHFDSCPNRDHKETFMLTDAELDEFAKTRGSYYYNRDKSLYPATPEKSIHK